MKVVIQRVSRASVTIDNNIRGSIGKGLLVLIGIEDGDTIDIKLQEGQLIANPERDPVPLKPAGDDLFFIRADQEIDIRFNLEKGTADNFLFMGERKILYRKI